MEISTVWQTNKEIISNIMKTLSSGLSNETLIEYILKNKEMLIYGIDIIDLEFGITIDYIEHDLSILHTEFMNRMNIRYNYQTIMKHLVEKSIYLSQKRNHKKQFKFVLAELECMPYFGQSWFEFVDCVPKESKKC